MSRSLFRKEVLEARRSTWLGEVALTQPLHWRVLTYAVGIVALAVVLFLVFATYTQRSPVQGTLVPKHGLATLHVPITGVLTSLTVAEGQQVQAGQVVAIIAVPTSTVDRSDTMGALAEQLQHRVEALRQRQRAQQQLLDSRESAQSAQLSAAVRELEQIKAQIETRQEQMLLADGNLKRLKELREIQYVSEVQVQQQQLEALDRLGDIQALQLQATSINRLISQLEQGINETASQKLAEEARFQSEFAALEQEIIEMSIRSGTAVTAPMSGSVTLSRFKPGETVQSGEPLLSVIPHDETLEAELLVPSRSIGFIKPGERVLLRYVPYPFQKFGHHGGIVASISRTPIDLPSAPSNHGVDGSFYRVSVTLDTQTIKAYGREERLRPGILVEADILGETRTLLEWVLEPLYSIEGVIH